MVKAAIKRIIRIALGLLVVILGIIQLFTPGQGLLFILVGLMIMAKDIPPLQRLGKRIQKRYPKQAAAVKKAERWLMEKLRRMFRIRSRSAEPDAAAAPPSNPGDKPDSQ